MVKIERTDPVTGEKTVTYKKFTEVQFNFPSVAIQREYMNQFERSKAEGKTLEQSKREAKEVAKGLILESMGKPAPKVKERFSETRILWLIIKSLSFWAVWIVLSFAFLGLGVGLAWKCFRWAMSL